MHPLRSSKILALLSSNQAITTQKIKIQLYLSIKKSQTTISMAQLNVFFSEHIFHRNCFLIFLHYNLEYSLNYTTDKFELFIPYTYFYMIDCKIRNHSTLKLFQNCRQKIDFSIFVINTLHHSAPIPQVTLVIYSFIVYSISGAMSTHRIILVFN